MKTNPATKVMDPAAKKNRKVGDPPLRRSSRLQSQAKPNPGLIAAKKNALLKMGSKKPAVFSFVNDIYQVASDSKDQVRLSTGFIYSEKMLEHKCLWDDKYPENPERLSRVVDRCQELGLLERCRVVKCSNVTEAQILRHHTKDRINILKTTKNCTDKVFLEELSSKYDSVYIHPSTYECSLLSAGSAIKLVDEICSRKIQNGMAFIRPPGHHAMKDEYCGYCFFNNVALAASHALQSGLERILIIDWDVHHGQGTQQMFYDDPRVLYISLHRYENGTFWPNLRESDFDSVGDDRGRGYNINVPLNRTGMTNADYLAAFHHIIMPVAYEFDPQLVIVSAGYDAALGCPEGEMELTPAVYAHFITLLSSLSNGKIAVILEGGYCLKSLAEGAALTLRALLGDPCPSIGIVGSPCVNMIDTLLNVIYVQREFWKCFKNNAAYSILDPPAEGEKRYLPTINYKFDEPKPRKYETRDCYPIPSDEYVAVTSAKLDQLILNTRLVRPPNRLCLIYDSKMMEHKNYEDRDHMEKPSRISSIYKMLEEFGILKRIHLLKSRYATDEELEYAHSRDHLTAMKNLKTMSAKQLIAKKDIFHSVYFHQDTFKAASLAAGCLLQVVDSVLTGESATGVAVVRPPGHHADIDDPCGFCIFNSVAVAAWYAIKNYGIRRVLIVDWDVHHGNGTQEIFLEESSVLYMSVHRFDNGEFFPHTGDGAAWQLGRGEGMGFTVNVPWNRSGMGDADYVSAFFKVLLPVAYQFDPELVLVSAGFDAAQGDPLGGCKVTPEAFGHFTSWLSPLANGRIILSLEGGYNIHSISYAMTMCTKALLGDPLPNLKEGVGPSSSALNSINETISYHSQYWTSLCLNQSLPVEDVLSPPKKLKTSDDSSPCPSENNNVTSSKNVLSLVCDGQLLRDLSLSEVGKIKHLAADGNEEGNKSGESGGGADSGGGGGGGNKETSTPSGSGMNLRSSSDRGQTLTDYLSENMKALVNEEMFAVVPLKSCPHLPCVRPVPDVGIDVNAPCSDCDDPTENWICLVCYTVECGRYIQEHMVQHYTTTDHPLALSFSDLSVWCYPCEAYIDNEVLHNAKNAAHQSKFGTPLTWAYHSK